MANKSNRRINEEENLSTGFHCGPLGGHGGAISRDGW
jgi:hypothetical protein